MAIFGRFTQRAQQAVAFAQQAAVALGLAALPGIDGEWLGEGSEDVAAGTKVEVVALRGTTLVVRAVDAPH